MVAVDHPVERAAMATGRQGRLRDIELILNEQGDQVIALEVIDQLVLFLEERVAVAGLDLPR